MTGLSARALGLIWVLLAALPVAASPTKDAECEAIAAVFSEASTGFRNTGNLNASTALVDRLEAGLQGLQLQDATLRDLQSRYLAYFRSSRQLLQRAGNRETAGDEAGLQSLFPLAEASSAQGGLLSQELVGYCLR